jgi:transcriptional regulator with XRE-family HTH domain
MKTLASFLKERRIAAGLSQIDVSRKLGYTSAQFVSNWERGIAKPRLKHWLKS